MTDQLAAVRRGSRAWWAAAVVAVVFLALHLPFLASTLEDVDSVNFALGLRHFDPAQHQPHPPGYPIYMALGKAANLVLSEPHALAIWGAVFGALAAFALLRLFAALDVLCGDAVVSDAPRTKPGDWLGRPVLAMVLTMAAPLYWMTASRPMSDMAGLSVTLAAQAILLTAMVTRRGFGPDASKTDVQDAALRSGRLVLIGAFVSAVAIGFRSQAAWLTVPLLTVVVIDRRRNAMSALIGAAVWFVAGTVLWLVPLVVASGGPRAYLAAFSSQAGEDWTGVDLLATHVGLRRLAVALTDTFVRHWAGAEWVVLAAAVLGAAVLIWRGRLALGVLIAAFVPYTLFHIVLQETVTTRYALPIIVPMAYLAAQGFFALRRVWGPSVGLLLALPMVIGVVPITARYAQEGSPVSRALADVRADAEKQPGTAVALHHRFKRSVEADPLAPALALPAPPKHEWLSLEQRWLAGDTGTTWFLADPRRTDLALIDPQAQTVRGDYSWGFASDVFLGGVRPDDLRWIIVHQPGWFAGEGWHLTPETAGVAQADGTGLDHGPIVAWLKRRPGAVTLLIGGRHLGKGAGPTARVSVRIDGRDVETWPVPPGEWPFLRFIAVPAASLAGEGPWARLEIQAVASDTGANTGIVAIDQFDAQPPDMPMAGFSEGWQEAEYNPSTGLSWRWASPKATLRVSALDRDVDVQVAGESPTKYFPRPSRVVLTVGSQQLLSVGAGSDFVYTVRVPASALKASQGVITLESDQFFRPADRGQSADRRALALRVYSVKIRPVS